MRTRGCVQTPTNAACSRTGSRRRYAGSSDEEVPDALVESTERFALGIAAALSTLLLLSAASPARAAEPTTVPLWPNGAPDAKGDTEHAPTLTIYLP